MLVLDLAGVDGRQAFMDRCVVDLRLPDWFSRNWDGLADCLTDLSWWPPEPGGRQLRLRNWQGFAAEMPREWRILKDILRDAEIFWRHTDTELLVVVEEGYPGTEQEARNVRP
ncbi:Barstar (barnase inhibitor) [Streptomyces sp. DvalAA-14]|uniref:barstar family protein n=1 Tax=unclassified Streptomyces TaxID=2593676 RepID=UPI00081B45ED|nr:MULTISPECIES: barstar family protein [unclassified Streptomyces]MYS22278.1 barnase inhibitor [Streptomyces sp. SID4948]SCE12739.1 Barstar (barnase inhibitor) [Streptomyces sp. DvalAA-14]